MKTGMQTETKQDRESLIGSSKLDRVMGIQSGMVVLRCRDKRLRNKLVSTALMKDQGTSSQTFYIYAAPNFLNAYGEFIHKTSQDLGLEWETLMRSVRFLNFSTDTPTQMEERWRRLEESSENTRLIVVDSMGHNTGRDSYLMERVNRFCYENDAIAIVLDSSDALDPTLERLSKVVVDLDSRDIGVEVFLRKHPRLPETVFLMSK